MLVVIRVISLRKREELKAQIVMRTASGSDDMRITESNISEISSSETMLTVKHQVYNAFIVDIFH